MLLVQVLVLVFTGFLWWVARRDLAARVPPPALAPQADTAELEQLCATLEALVTSLARRLDAVERASESRPPAPNSGGAEPNRAERWDPLPAEAVSAEPLPDPRYEPVYALLASGVADPVEIARRTGLGRGEVNLILSLRDRRAL